MNLKNKKTVFICQNCGVESLKWQGKCFNCGEFGTLVETVQEVRKVAARPYRALERRHEMPQLLREIQISQTPRLSTGISEFDRVLGKGLVPGGVVLLGGEPGIGKSTLLLQVAASILLPSLPSQPSFPSTLYISAEESPAQIRLRAERLGIGENPIQVLAENDVDLILENISIGPPSSLLIIDSIQTIFTSDLSSPAGSISQVQECTRRLINFVKPAGIPLILVGHVTKQGNLAGPKTLEHLVDTVLYLEGERFGDFRLLRCVKNRFGAVAEVGIFKMGAQGLEEVQDPSAEFLSNRQAGVPGSVVTVTLEGLRPMLLEIQALTTRTAFGYPRRVVTGISLSRLLMLLAVLQKRLGFNFANHDVYINVSGGLKINEPAADLAVCLSLASSLKNKALNEKIVAFGEVGLLGEVKRIGKEQLREKEAKKMGFENILSGSKIRSVKEAVGMVFN